MSFTFTWPRFSPQFHTDAIEMLNTALNKGNKPPVIADRIEVVELEMGTQPPELEIRDIGELTTDQFRGIFRLTYAGDAHIVLKTKVQANPLNHKQPDIHLMSGSRGMLAAKHPLVVPMLLRLSHFKLNSYVVLVVSKQKGITLVFKTDPLQNVDINSTFDSIEVIQMFIQREIEGQLRQMFREDLPGIIHRLSQQWVKASVEKTPSSPKEGPHRPQIPSRRQTDSSPHRPMMMMAGPRSTSGVSVASTGRRTSASSSFATAKSSPSTPAPATDHFSSFPDLENFDPTYGLRPEGLPAKSVFRGFGELFSASKGLADLAEESSSQGGGDEGYETSTQYDSFDMVDWEDTVPDFSIPDVQRHSMSDAGDDPTEYETMPAIGGGTITRPRVYHSQSMMQASSPSRPRTPSLRSGLSSILRPGSASVPISPRGTPFISRNPSLLHTSYFPEPSESDFNTRRSSDSVYSSVPPHRPANPSPLYGSISPPPNYRRPQSPESQPSRSSSGSVRTPDSSEVLPHQLRSYLRDQKQQQRPYEDDPGIYMKATQASSSRRPSISVSIASTSERDPFPERDVFMSSSPPQHHHRMDSDPKIILRPSLNNSIHQLSTLSHSNHTLSPYTRSFEHFTVRSVPPKGTATTPTTERIPVKAKRKRLHRLGGGGGGGGSKGKPTLGVTTHGNGLHSALPPSEFDASDMDRYFTPTMATAASAV